jgi:serine/threonine-protein kinase
MKNEPNRPESPSIETDVRVTSQDTSEPGIEVRAAQSEISALTPGAGRLAEGSRFGVYVVGACIGQGGMARVYRAQHEGLQRQVALKVLIDGVGHDGAAHERFLREARIAAAIKHPNVVNIFDVGVCEGIPYLVMELLEGVDLDAYVESHGKLDENTIVDIIVPIVAGLAAVHEAGIVHRDLKPGNIFLARGRNEELEPKLLDFGISKAAGPDQLKLTSARNMLIGTPFYMAPEAARGAEVTALSDQYALGVVLYECATGVNPFTGANNFGEVVSRVSTGSFDPISSKNPVISKKLTSIIERAMHIDPQRRFPNMRAMGRELLQLAGQRTRITWGLNFGDLAGIGASLAPLEASSVIRHSGSPGPSKRSKTAAASLVGLTLLGAGWLASTRHYRAPEPGATPVETAAIAPSAREAALAEQPIARLTPLTAQDEALPIAHALSESADAELETPAPAPADTQQVEPKKRSPAKVRRSPRKERAAVPTLTATVNETLLTPEWAVETPSEPIATSATGRGTNNAPILE